MVKTAVVILNYNGKDYLEKFLPSVIKHSNEAEIVVADNNSSDSSAHFLKDNFPEVSLIELPKNYGFAGGYNEALRNIQAEYFVLLNSDVEVSPNWLDPLIHFLENNEGYAACQPKIKDYNQQTKFEYAGACGGFIDTLGYPYCRGRIFDNIEVDHGQYDQPTDVFWSSGACMAIRSKVFFEVGEFDSDFFAHMEEIDLCWRIQSHGYRIKCIPASTVYHVGGGTLNKSSAFKTYLNFRNGLYLLLKNLPKSALFTKIPMRMALDWLASIKFLLEGSPGHAIAIVKAHTSFISNFRKTYNKRSINSNLPDSKMLVFRYYLKKQKVFNKI